MKRLFTFILLSLLTIVNLLARTPEQAAQLASRFLKSDNTISVTNRLQQASPLTSVEMVYTQLQVGTKEPALYVFNGKEKGYVIVSANDDSRAILGYSDVGAFDAENIPTNMQFWLQMYADELAQYEANKPVLKQGQVAIDAKKRVATSYPVIAPIMSTIWGQGAPYNNQCPIINGERSVVGCVATAISQIMYTHKYPTKGIGSKTYTTATHNKTLTVDFSSATYDWDNMLPTYTKGYTTDQANAVATLCYHVGVAAEMDYSPNSSGTTSQVALINMATHFGYDKGMNILLKDFMLENDIINAIAADLQKGYPVYVGGVTKNSEGHAFVCDGLNSDGYLHINWGWNGMSDGYFAISALDPDNQGTGGSSGDLAFTESVEVFTNIIPDEGGEAKALVTVDDLTRTSADELSRMSQVAFSLDKFISCGLKTAQGTLSYFIYDSNNELVQIIPCDDFELPAGYGYTDAIDISAYIPASLANGEYELEVGYMDENNTNQSIFVKRQGVVRIPFTATSSQLIFGETGDGGGEVGEVDAVTQIDVCNVEQSNVWEIDLYSNYFWGDTPYDDEVLIRFTVNSGSTTSVIGSYVLDVSNSGKAGTINTEGMYAVGYYDACYQYDITDMHVTISDVGNGALKVEYYMVANGEEHTAVVTIAAPNWYLSQNGNYYYYQDYITRELASTIPASKALALTQALNHTNETEIAYYVSGIISNMRNTPEQIVQYKTARFDISDDGNTNNQLYCYNTKWLENSDFTTGNEVNVNDEVVIYGVVQNYQGNTPEIKGYVYQHKTSKNYEITNLQVRAEGSTVYFSFESEAPNFHVKVIESNGEIEVEGITNSTKVAINDLAKGTYTLWVRPVDEAKEYYVGDAVEAGFEIITSETIDNIIVPHMLELYDLMGRLVDSKLSNENRAFEVPASGVYIQRGNNTQKIYINKR